MKTEEMTNIEIVDAMKFMEGPIKDKKLPIKMSYAIRRSMASFKRAYDPYIETLTELCNSYGCSINNTSLDDPEKQKELNKEINELLAAKTTVEIYPISFDVLEECGTENYDSLTYEDLNKLWWIVDDEEESLPMGPDSIPDVVDNIPE